MRRRARPGQVPFARVPDGVVVEKCPRWLVRNWRTNFEALLQVPPRREKKSTSFYSLEFEEARRSTCRAGKPGQIGPEKRRKAIPECLGADAGQKLFAASQPKGAFKIWLRLRVQIWSHVGF